MRKDPNPRLPTGKVELLAEEVSHHNGIFELILLCLKGSIKLKLNVHAGHHTEHCEHQAAFPARGRRARCERGSAPKK